MTMESLLEDEDLKSTIKDLVISSGRSYPGIDGLGMQKDDSGNRTQILVKKQIANGKEKFASVHLNGEH